MQTSLGVTDGERLWAFRYSTERKSRTLFVSAEVATVHALYPDNAKLQRLRDEDRIIVSEPLADLPGAWIEIPESTVMIVQPGPDEQRPFRPHYQPAAANGAPAGFTHGRLTRRSITRAALPSLRGSVPGSTSSTSIPRPVRSRSAACTRSREAFAVAARLAAHAHLVGARRGARRSARSAARRPRRRAARARSPTGRG